jgi:hypothetical protein
MITYIAATNSVPRPSARGRVRVGWVLFTM